MQDQVRAAERAAEAGGHEEEWLRGDDHLHLPGPRVLQPVHHEATPRVARVAPQCRFAQLGGGRVWRRVGLGGIRARPPALVQSVRADARAVRVRVAATRRARVEAGAALAGGPRRGVQPRVQVRWPPAARGAVVARARAARDRVAEEVDGHTLAPVQLLEEALETSEARRAKLGREPRGQLRGATWRECREARAPRQVAHGRRLGQCGRFCG
mmetsp:Transcript_41182/g.95389  ORF Transcript_41182/g.95389 Transcript_41182/m.95389 type:complete len:213 (+) Transcript_41182:1238-1876(+)